MSLTNFVFFGGLALLLAAIVVRRTREIEIRMALGAQRWDVLWLVMRETLGLAVIGMLAALAAARLVASQLFGVSRLTRLPFAARSRC